MRVTLERTAEPEAADLSRLGASLAAFNEGDVGPSDRRALAVFARDDGGEILAGLSGYTAWGWLYVQWLWVAEAARGRGLAATLLAEAEAEALARDCHGAWIDTFNPVALRVYEAAGYTPFGALDEFPRGRARTFLQKRLRD
ncbi:MULTISPECIES: GNAT family N-acetyltransferase [unclassified Aureimonas]|uniref:GNAT family N-acetyltransferase n=1 Tax=unclassified Aureimonas TaxID=2615206 RepID=UPI0006FC457F|nr:MULTISPECIES: GNAT family N-acetyltransferase [unclassified Aureimonas]KQT66294.1 acetyltransferase [Aureimonas sp. Leaf427]KQT72476.1 acetyltransferase [Aureimonas sp. Leaf460]